MEWSPTPAQQIPFKLIFNQFSFHLSAFGALVELNKYYNSNLYREIDQASTVIIQFKFSSSNITQIKQRKFNCGKEWNEMEQLNWLAALDLVSWWVMSCRSSSAPPLHSLNFVDFISAVLLFQLSLPRRRQAQHWLFLFFYWWIAERGSNGRDERVKEENECSGLTGAQFHNCLLRN